MRAVFLTLVITWLLPAPEKVTTAHAAAARANRVSVAYVPPKNAAHQPIYEAITRSQLSREVATISRSVPTPARVAGESRGMRRGCQCLLRERRHNGLLRIHRAAPEGHAGGNDSGRGHAVRRRGGPSGRHLLA